MTVDAIGQVLCKIQTKTEQGMDAAGVLSTWHMGVNKVYQDICNFELLKYISHRECIRRVFVKLLN